MILGLLIVGKYLITQLVQYAYVLGLTETFEPT